MAPGELEFLGDIAAPPSYTVKASGLSIVAPRAPATIPFPVPIPVPKWLEGALSKKKGDEEALENGDKVLLKGVSLECSPGEVLALVGGSGSGKTTLLNSLAARLPKGLVQAAGSVSFIPASDSDTPRRPVKKGLRGIIGYVRQDDFLLPYLTVRETLTFAAALRLPKSVSESSRLAVVEATMSELGLSGRADTLVGGGLRKGLSGGERRRLSIGCILVCLPSVLVLDEPTTGLDATTALSLLSLLSNLAKRGRSIILSIHQPRSDSFPLFDKVCLLSSGHVVYSGVANGLLPHFSAEGFEPEEHTAIMDFALDVSSKDTRTDEQEVITSQRVARLVGAWRAREAEGKGTDEMDGMRSPDLEQRGIERVTSRSSALSTNRSDKPEGRPGVLVQTSLLTIRGWRNVSRNYGQLAGFLAQAIVIGVALGLAFYRIPESPGGIQSLKTIAYQEVPAFFYLISIVYTFILCQELVIFDREREDGLYEAAPAIVATLLAYLPGNIVFPLIYSLLVYFICGMRTSHLASSLLQFLAQNVLQQLCAFTYAVLAASLSRSFARASLLANGFSIPFILSAGYLIVDLGPWVSWLRWISPYFYGFQWNARVQFAGRSFACDGVVGPARNSCDGDAVLRGLKVNVATPMYVYPLGLLGFVLVTTLLATLVLSTYNAGGVKQANQVYRPDSKEQLKVEKAAPEKDPSLKGSTEIRVVNLSLDVNVKKVQTSKVRSIRLLDDVSAVFPAGKISAIMGPSGSGKTTLLELLAGRLHSGPLSEFSVTGTLLINNQPISSANAGLTAYVPQFDDYHLPALTVRETLHYASSLQLSTSSKAARHARAEEVLRSLGLKPCADNLVGNSLIKGISGGEKRRLSLAVQLLSSPSVIFADEPLSGLDAFTAQNVMLLLKQNADAGRTVILSLHQPRSDIYALVDNILLLVKGGSVAYAGAASEILKTVEAATGLAPPPFFNRADFIIDSVTDASGDISKDSVKAANVQRLIAMNKALHGDAEESVAPTASLEAGRRISASFFVAFPTIVARSVKNLSRQGDAIMARLVNPPFLALLFFLFFGRLGLGPGSSQTRVGLLQETTALPFVGMLATLAIYPTERSLFLHERRTAARYSSGTFLLSYTIQETAVTVVSSLLFTLVIVYGPGLRAGPRRFVEFWWTVFALLSWGESIGIAFASWFENGGLAVSLVSAVITLGAQINGIISVTIPYWLQVIGWSSPMKLQSRVEIINEFVGLRFNCTDAEVVDGTCIALTGEQMLEAFSIKPEGTGKFMGILFALVLLYRLLAWACLEARVRAI